MFEPLTTVADLNHEINKLKIILSTMQKGRYGYNAIEQRMESLQRQKIELEMRTNQ